VAGGSLATILSGYISDFLGVRQVFPFLAALSALAALFALLLPEPKPAEATEQVVG